MRLMPFQREGVRQIEEWHGRVLLADEMGLGKTIQALRWIKHHNDSLPAAVVCPAYLKDNWKAEITKWLGLRVAILEGRKRKATKGADIYILSYECVLPVTFQRKRKKVHNKNTWTEWLRKKNIRTAVADEAHYLKNKKAIRSKGFKQLSRNVPHVLLLTGTPVENRPSELWFLLHILVPNLFPHWFRYGMRYCAGRYDGFSWSFDGASHLDELQKKLRDTVMVRRLKKDVLKDLPKKRRAPLLVTVTGKALTEYTQASDNFKEWLQDNDKDPKALKAEALVRLGVLKRLAAEAKIPSMLLWVQDALEMEKKVVIYCVHRSVGRTLHKELASFGAVLATGDIAKKKRREAVLSFQQDDSTRVFIGTFAAAGTGITLTRASHILIAELPWSVSTLSQGEDRLHRIGQTKPVWSWLAVAKGTVDEDLLELLDWKSTVVSSALDHTKIKEEDKLWQLIQKKKR